MNKETDGVTAEEDWVSHVMQGSICVSTGAVAMWTNKDQNSGNVYGTGFGGNNHSESWSYRHLLTPFCICSQPIVNNLLCNYEVTFSLI